ncbi:late competence development ComFB family protein [Pleionea mediterranea]|jgi:competence protein ComFB|uniref:Competence protein ComFB n=1 Tax=Pleionea mediterranea TaxID=523701 RepID=A0A316FNG2_9GAMM|nr:late competence development ComFB family protein [Pleionea mediterranea]PWK49226.1 competence protein ComFB [Pleionea mediterranea]
MYKEMYYHDDLENLAEEIVFEQIHELIQSGEQDFNQSDVNIQDIAAIALNNMPAKYVCNFLEKQNPGPNLREEVNDLKKYAKRQVIKAIKKVNKHPHD